MYKFETKIYTKLSSVTKHYLMQIATLEPPPTHLQALRAAQPKNFSGQPKPKALHHLQGWYTFALPHHEVETIPGEVAERLKALPC